MVAQVDKQELAVVALAVHPAREAGGDAGIREAQRATGVGTISVHQGFRDRGGKGAANTARSAALVKKRSILKGQSAIRRAGFRTCAIAQVLL